MTDRFWVKVDVQGQDDCWPWTASTQPSGYGQMRWAGKICLAHRLAWSLVNGPIPDGMQVNHRCHNKLCCNTAHMELLSIEAHGLDSAIIAWGTLGDESTCRRGHTGYRRKYGKKWACLMCQRECRRSAA